MIIRIVAKGRSIAIDDPDNFKAFSVRVEGPLEDAARAELFGRIAVRHDEDHAWISEQALRDWPTLKSESWWQDGLTRMMAAVERFGWIDRDARAIRAHIDFA
jgi:predicted transcriptional regulator